MTGLPAFSSVVLVLLVVLLLVAAVRLWSTARRLDRLHVRTEAAWAALEVALTRRIAAVRAAAAAGAWDAAAADRLRSLTKTADRPGRGGRPDPARRADAENDLSRALEELPPVTTHDLATELGDAAERISLARSFYNDAVRDTRALRGHRFTRLFRLAGRAALPDYFEIADVSGPPRPRSSARVVLADHGGRVLLFSSADPAGRTIWFTPGGGVEPGEDLRSAARRELLEETGLYVDGDLSGPIWHRQAQFVFAGVAFDQSEYYFAARSPEGFQVDTSGFTSVETASLTGHRWWTPEELRATSEIVYPTQLADRLGEALHAAGSPGARYPDPPPVIS